MPMRQVGKEEQLEVCGVTFRFVRVSNKVKTAAENRHTSRQGVVNYNKVLEDLMNSNIKGIIDDPNNPETWFEDSNGERIPPDVWRPGDLQHCTVDDIFPLIDAMNMGSYLLGKEGTEDGEDREKNSGTG